MGEPKSGAIIIHKKSTKKDLVALLWGDNTYHHNTSDFREGEEVFLKSNPELKMTIFSFSETQLLCTWRSWLGNLQMDDFPPEAVVQYNLRISI